MTIRKLLLPALLLLLAQSLRGTALAETASSDAQKHWQTSTNRSPGVDRSTDADPSSASPSATDSATDQVYLPDAQKPTIRSPLLSTLILPLPPLLVPDLLLPPYSFPTFNSQRLDQELQLYTQYLRTFGPPDVLIVGSSRSLQGIDPSALQEALSSRGYSGLRVYNFGINGATAKVINLLLQKVLTPEQMPKLLIWGDGSRAFNSGRPDITYNGIVASAGYRQLQEGDRPIPSRRYWNQVALSAAIKPASPASRSNRPRIPDLDSNGFQVVSSMFDPNTYFQRYPKVPGEFDADYENFRLWGDQTDATIAVARFARQNRIPLVLVNLPLTQDYIDGTRSRYEQQFRQHMQQLAAQFQFSFCDLSQEPDLQQHRYFADPSHINRHGARAIGIRLASHPAVPWQMFK